MNKSEVIFETMVTVKEGSPYLATKSKIQFIMTENEIQLTDPKWKLVIPLCCVFTCIAKPMIDRRTVTSARPIIWNKTMVPIHRSRSTIEIMNNFILIEYSDNNNQRTSLQLIVRKYFLIKSNVGETMRFNETVEKYRLRDKFRKDTMPENEK